RRRGGGGVGRRARGDSRRPARGVRAALRRCPPSGIPGTLGSTMRLRAGFMGSPEFAVPSLRVVAERCDLRVVVCQPDRPAGRGRKLTAPAVKAAAQAFGVPIEQPVKMRDGTLARTLAEHELDVVVVVAFGRILPPDILALPRYGCINVHGS